MGHPNIEVKREQDHAEAFEDCIPPRLKDAAIVVIGTEVDDELHIHLHVRGNKQDAKEQAALVHAYLGAWLAKVRD